MRTRMLGLLVGATLPACAPAASPEVAAPPPPVASSVASQGPSEPPAPPPRRLVSGDLVVLLVDRSGSMSGTPMEMAKKAVRGAPDACPACRFEVIAFDTAPLHAATYDPKTGREPFDRAVQAVQPGGGTYPLAALQLAVKLVAKEPKGGHVVLLTDGVFPTEGLDEVIGELVAALGSLSTVGLGTGVDELLLARMARRGRGSARIVEHAGDLPAAFRSELSPP